MVEDYKMVWMLGRLRHDYLKPVIENVLHFWLIELVDDSFWLIVVAEDGDGPIYQRSRDFRWRECSAACFSRIYAPATLNCRSSCPGCIFRILAHTDNYHTSHSNSSSPPTRNFLSCSFHSCAVYFFCTRSLRMPQRPVIFCCCKIFRQKSREFSLYFERQFPILWVLFNELIVFLNQFYWLIS